MPAGASCPASRWKWTERSTVLSHSYARTLQANELDAGAGHAGESLRVCGARRGDGVLDDDHALPKVEQPEGRLRDAHVGLEPAEHDRRTTVSSDVFEDWIAGGEVEDRLRMPVGPPEEAPPRSSKRSIRFFRAPPR